MLDPKLPPNVQIKEFSAGVIVFRDHGDKRKYLLLHYPSGHFDFAKGHLEKGETEKQAAIRELEEETGIKQIDLLEGFIDQVVYFFKRKGELIYKRVTFFLGRTNEGDIKLSDEHQGYLWLDYQAALAKITFENAREILRQAEQFLTNY